MLSTYHYVAVTVTKVQKLTTHNRIDVTLLLTHHPHDQCGTAIDWT